MSKANRLVDGLEARLESVADAKRRRRGRLAGVGAALSRVYDRFCGEPEPLTDEEAADFAAYKAELIKHLGG